MQWLRRWALPAFALASIALNVALLSSLWRQQAYVNRYLWGGATIRLSHGLVWLDTGQDPGGRAERPGVHTVPARVREAVRVE